MDWIRFSSFIVISIMFTAKIEKKNNKNKNEIKKLTQYNENDDIKSVSFLHKDNKGNASKAEVLTFLV